MMPLTYLMVKGYARHQHYGNRAPVWIKLYNAVMDDEAFLALPDAARGHLILLWLLASRRQNKLPNDAKLLARAIQATSKVNVRALIDAGFLLPWDASTALAKPAKSASTSDNDDAADDTKSAIAEGEGEEEGEERRSPPARVLSLVEAQLAEAAGEHYADVARWLDARPADVREQWAADLLQHIGPVTGNLPEDLARACRDGALATPPVTNAKALRRFVAECREERLRGVIPARGAARGAAPTTRGRELLDLFRRCDLLTYGGNAAEWAAKVDRAAADPLAGASFRAEVDAARPWEGIAGTNDHFRALEIDRRLAGRAA